VIWLPVVGFLVGFLIIWMQGITVPSEFASYLSLAAIAGIDTILGGIRSGLEKRFRSDIFLSGFIVNTLMAALLAYFGDQIGVPDLYLAAVIALGGRIFLNLTLIRYSILGQPRPDRSLLNETGIFGVAPRRPPIASQAEEAEKSSVENA
jgi:small basic protein